MIRLAHEADCPLADGDLDDAIDRMITLDRLFNRGDAA
jgi:hypothetical protein